MKWALLLFFLLPACKSTYKQETIKESVKMVAKRDYNLDVQVKESGRTLGVRYSVPDLFTELIAEDQAIWKKMDDLIQTLSRVSLSVDVPPHFMVLEVADEANMANKIIFTQCVVDIKKLYAEALSRNQYFDRLTIEFEVNGKRTPFDHEQTDLVSLMMLVVEAQAAVPSTEQSFELTEIKMKDFLPKVAEALTRRLFRENKQVKEAAILRDASGRFDFENDKETSFNLMLDVASRPGEKVSSGKLQTAVFPLITEEVGRLFKSYRFTDFSHIVVMDKNSGAITITGRK